MALTDDAITKIKDMILGGQLSAGDRLPPEKELSEQLGLSRSSLREAVKALETIRVLDVRRGDGTYVTSLEPKLLQESVSFMVELHSDTSVMELLEVRRILESSAAFIAANRITAGDIARLGAEIDDVDASSVEDLLDHDLRFHGIIAEAAGNAYLAGLLSGLNSRTVRARIWRALTQQNAVERTLAEHRAIAAALESGDAELARAATVVHISGVEQWLRAALLADPTHRSGNADFDETNRPG
ncbi:FadR/GntR family transcriptional regulator [Arthrobacter sp. HLT1-21]